MVFVWALAKLARGCVVLRAARHAPRLYRALAPYAGRAAVCAGAVMCAGSTDFYLAGLAALGDDVRRRTGITARPPASTGGSAPGPCSRTPCTSTRCCCGSRGDHAAASAALAEARAIAADCGMTKLLAALEQPGQPGQQPRKAMPHPDTGRTISGSSASPGAITRVPDSLGLRYLDLLVRHPGRELTALDLVQPRPRPARRPPHAHRRRPARRVRAHPPSPILDQQARTAYRQRLTELDEELAEAEQWNDTERASRLRAEKDFLVRELAAATGLGGRPRRLGAESERARLNVTRAIRSAIARIRDRAPAAAAHLDQAVRTGTRCSYSPQKESS